MTVIKSKRIDEMKKLVKLSKEKGIILSADAAFQKYSPEGTWIKDKDGNIVVKRV